MAPDEEGDEEQPIGGVLPPDDRLWRHPSELAATEVPDAWLGATPAPPQGPRRALAVAALASACVTGAVLAVGVMWMARPTKVVVRDAPEPAPRATATFASAIPTDRIAAQVAPSLVHIVVEPADGGEATRGTGVWLDEEGTIAVANDLVARAGSVLVTDHEGVRHDGVVAGADPATGIAIVRVPTKTGRPLVLDAAGCTTGQAVAVVGTAANAPEGTTTPQVLPAAVSAVSLRLPLDASVLHDAVQLDRGVPDSSSGALVVDGTGRAVAIVVDPAGDDQLAVAVPASVALAAARDLSEHGEVRRAWLGVRAVDLEAQVAKLLGVSNGALLTRVDAGSPASAAGMASGDVITAIDDQRIADASDLVVVLRSHRPGDRVEVAWRRGMTGGSTTITLAG